MRFGPMVPGHFRKRSRSVTSPCNQSIRWLEPEVFTHIRAGPAQHQCVTCAAAAQVGHDKCHIGEELGHVVQGDGVDTEMAGGAAGRAQDAKADGHRDLAVDAHLPG